MKNWRSILISPDTSILKAIETINKGELQAALVVNDERQLLGIVADGDIRRGILRNIQLNEPVQKIMTKNYSVARSNDSNESIFALMKEKELRHIPLVDDRGRVTDLKVLFDLVIQKKERLDNWVIIMAGGIGTRLRPLTNESPKPLLKVGGKPLLETIIENLRDHGLYRFFISINYRAEMIEQYFGDGTKWGIQIDYLREEKRLGTAGALSLLPEDPDSSLLVMNSDLLTKVNFRNLLDFHVQNNSTATMCVKEYEFIVPFGVVHLEGSRLLGLEEKPTHRFFVNAGIYVLEPVALHTIPKGTYFDITTLFDNLLDSGRKTITFPIHEYWLDIGGESDYKQANGDFCKYFKDESYDKS
ncbi:MAG: nucleotidyltransferase family protein [Desulfobacterales bacterium]|jgi:dTDP-glucose pyrophosphorylase|nr:nucleotidyltransferase family protein [Desulfobacterales bacterium]